MTDELAPTAVVAMVGLRIYPGTALAELACKAGVIGEREPLLEPRFYAAGLSGRRPARRLALPSGACGRRRPPQLVPARRPRLERRLGPRLLRRLGKPGPLWRNFPRPRWYRYV